MASFEIEFYFNITKEEKFTENEKEIIRRYFTILERKVIAYMVAIGNEIERNMPNIRTDGGKL